MERLEHQLGHHGVQRLRERRQRVEQYDGGVLLAEPAQMFAFDEIVEAHRIMESGTAGGKLVVVL